MFTGLYVMYRGNLSLSTYFNFFFMKHFLRIFEFVRILVEFNKINCIVILLKGYTRLNNKQTKYCFERL